MSVPYTSVETETETEAEAEAEAEAESVVVEYVELADRGLVHPSALKDVGE
jgi:hypothetical protein